MKLINAHIAMAIGATTSAARRLFLRVARDQAGSARDWLMIVVVVAAVAAAAEYGLFGKTGQSMFGGVFGVIGSLFSETTGNVRDIVEGNL